MAKGHCVVFAVGKKEAPNTSLAWQYLTENCVQEYDQLVLLHCVGSAIGTHHVHHRDPSDARWAGKLHTTLSEACGPWTADLVRQKYDWLTAEMAEDLGTRFRDTIVVEFDAEDGIADGVLSWVHAHQGVDLLVLGSRGLTHLKKVLIGSVSSYLVKTVPCTVCVVRERVALVPAPASGVRNVVIALDGKGQGLSLVEYAKEHLLRPADGVTLAHSPYKTKATDQSKKVAEDELAECKLALSRFLEGGGDQLEALLLDPVMDPRDSLCEVAEKLAPMGGCHMLILAGKTDPQSLKRRLLGSTSQYVMEHAQCPVTIVRQTTIESETRARAPPE